MMAKSIITVELHALLGDVESPDVEQLQEILDAANSGFPPSSSPIGEKECSASHVCNYRDGTDQFLQNAVPNGDVDRNSDIQDLEPHLNEEEPIVSGSLAEDALLVAHSKKDLSDRPPDSYAFIIPPRDLPSNPGLPPSIVASESHSCTLAATLSSLPTTSHLESRYLITQDTQPKSVKYVGNKLRLVDVNGNSLVKRAVRNSTMEHFDAFPFGSGGSTLSATQEIDPTIIEQKLRESMTRDTRARSSQNAPSIIQNEADHADAGKSAPLTEQSYATGDQGYIGLNLDTQQTQIFDSPIDSRRGQYSQLRFDSNVNTPEVAGPETPAPPKNPFGMTGNVLLPSEMFGFTQVTPAPPNNFVAPSSSRPSPDIVTNRKDEADDTSSPIHRHVPMQSSPNILPYISSSPPASSHPIGPLSEDYGQDRPPISISSDVVAEMPPRTSSFRRHNNDPINTYRSRRESQERRKLQNKVTRNDADSSDDDFETEIQRQFRIRRTQDARLRELDKFSVSLRAPTASDEIEVPSTSKGRRRSQSEELIPQAADGNESQQEMIVDSQTRKSSADTQDSHRPSNIGLIQSTKPTLDGNGSDEEMPDPVPALYHHAEGDQTSSDRQNSTSPPERSTAQPRTEASFTAQVLQTPAVSKLSELPEGDPLVPETSPMTPHRAFNAIRDEPDVSPQVDLDGIGFTQGEDDHLIFASSQPVQPARRRVFGKAKGKERATVSTVSEDTDDEDAASGSAINIYGPVEQLQTKIKVIEDEIQTNPVPEDVESRRLRSPEMLRGASRTLRRTVDTGDNTSKTSISLRSIADNENAMVTKDGNKLIETKQSFLESSSRPKRTSRSSTKSLQAEHNPPAKSPTHTAAASKLKKSTRQSRKVSAVSDVITVQPKISAAAKVDSGIKPLNKLPSSRALRASAKVQNDGFSTPTPSLPEAVSAFKNTARASRRSSANNSEKARSEEPHGLVTPGKAARKGGLEGLFSNMAFAVSYTDNEREKKLVVQYIQQHKGLLLENGFDELFDVSSEKITSPQKSEDEEDELDDLTIATDAQTLGFTCLIADKHSRKAKFMQALALSLPCISGKWIETCVEENKIVDWEPYLLAAGESDFLGGAVRSRNLQPYSPISTTFAQRYEVRKKMLKGKSILLVMAKGKVEERKKAYVFLTRVLGAARVNRVQNNEAAKKLLSEQGKDRTYDFIYVDGKEETAEEAIFGATTVPAPNKGQRKRKRASGAEEYFEEAPNKRAKIIGDKFVVQSLILGRLIYD